MSAPIWALLDLPLGMVTNYVYVITGIKLGGMLLLNKLSVFVSTIYEYQNIAYLWFDILNAMMSN